MAETDCAEVRLTEKSKAAAGEKVRERRSRIWREKQWVNKSNYWLGYEDFLKIAQAALDCGCIIIKKVSGKLIYKRSLDIVTEHEHNYWFYVPEAGVLSGNTLPFNDNDIQGYSPAGNTLIEAGFSFRNDKSKTITRSRLFVISGYYDEQGEYISRPEYVTKTYNKLVRIVKKVAPLTELTDNM